MFKKAAMAATVSAGGRDRVADEDRVVEIQSPHDVDDVRRVAVEAAVPLRVVCRQVGTAGPDEVEQDRPVPVLERWRHEAPHVLVTSKSVGENHRLTVGPTTSRDIVSGQNVDIHTDHDKPVTPRRLADALDAPGYPVDPP